MLQSSLAMIDDNFKRAYHVALLAFLCISLIVSAEAFCSPSGNSHLPRSATASSLTRHPAPSPHNQCFLAATSPLRSPQIGRRTSVVRSGKIGKGSCAMSPLAASLRGGIGNSITRYNDDDWLKEIPPKPVIDAVMSSKSKKIMSPDLAVSAGIPLRQAERNLATLAALTGARMTVTDQGELVYEFPDRLELQSMLLKKNLRFRARAAAERYGPPLFYGVRVSFGVMLFLSILAIFTTLAALQAAQESANDNDNNRGRRSSYRSSHMHFNFFGPRIFGPSPFDLFYYRTYSYGYYDRYPKGRAGPTGVVGQKEENGMSLLEAIFSYVFGDGNPNHELPRLQLQAAASFIRSEGGAVTAEQLSPFLPDVPDLPKFQKEASSTALAVVDYVDESYVLPLVLQLGGEPSVTPDGNIVYVFPELMTTTETSTVDLIAKRRLQRSGRIVPSAGEALEERELEFSVASDNQKVIAGGLGILNLLGALSLGGALSARPGLKLPGMFGVVQQSYPLLVTYAILFNVIPLGRYLVLKKKNDGIRRRNSNRYKWKSLLRSPNESVRRKLTSAKKFAKRLRRVKNDDKVIFDTHEDIIDQTKRKSNNEFDDFDDLLFKS